MSLSKIIDSNTAKIAKEWLKKIGKVAKISRKLEAVVAAEAHGIDIVAKIYDVTRKTLTSWAKVIKLENIEKLETGKGRGRKSPLSDDNTVNTVKEWVKADPTLTIAKIKAKLEEELSITSSLSAVQRFLKKSGLSYITARPRHYKKDEVAEVAFKKKSS